MPAGAKSTAAPTSDTRLSVKTDFPHQPRTFTSGEATSREIFVFYSPKNDRVVAVSDYIHFALALSLEFDPTVKKYVERPRKIALSPEVTIDLSFWTQDNTGHEQHLLAIPKGGTIGNARDGVLLRDRTRLETAAQRHDLQLTFVLEQELINQAALIRVYFLLLPHVQQVRRIADRIAIRHGIETLLKTTMRAALSQLVAAFPNYMPDHIEAVAAWMIHLGMLRLTDARPLSLNSLLEVRDAA
jgi:hypothetical protein